MENASLQQLVQQLISTLGVTVDKVEITGTHRTVVSVSTPDSALLIGENGETLRALNALAKRLVEAQYGVDVATFIIDVNGYQEAQLDKVRGKAQMLAQRVRLFKHNVELDPMSPYERLVVHEQFAKDPDIATESTGEGKFRHVVLKYKSK